MALSLSCGVFVLLDDGENELKNADCLRDGSVKSRALASPCNNVQPPKHHVELTKSLSGLLREDISFAMGSTDYCHMASVDAQRRPVLAIRHRMFLNVEASPGKAADWRMTMRFRRLVECVKESG